MDRYLAATSTIEADHPEVRAYAERAIGDATTVREKAIRLYNAVRDDFIYDPYRLTVTEEGLAATTTLELGYGWCISKAVLLAAAARSVGIPARLAFADVKNHLTTERLYEMMGSDVFAFHGTTEMLIEGAWVRCTPAFNSTLCHKFGVEPLEWDGINDSLLQPFTIADEQFMEYVNDRGTYDDLPIQEITDTFKELYGAVVDQWLGEPTEVQGDFGDDGATERSAAAG